MNWKLRCTVQYFSSLSLRAQARIATLGHHPPSPPPPLRRKGKNAGRELGVKAARERKQQENAGEKLWFLDCSTSPSKKSHSEMTPPVRHHRVGNKKSYCFYKSDKSTFIYFCIYWVLITPLQHLLCRKKIFQWYISSNSKTSRRKAPSRQVVCFPVVQLGAWSCR